MNTTSSKSGRQTSLLDFLPSAPTGYEPREAKNKVGSWEVSGCASNPNSPPDPNYYNPLGEPNYTKRVLEKKTKSIQKRRKQQLEELFGDSCMICQTAKYSHLHHRNKHHSDNRIKNLLLVCPLCHKHADMKIIDISGIRLVSSRKYSLKNVYLDHNGIVIKPKTDSVSDSVDSVKKDSVSLGVGTLGKCNSTNTPARVRTIMSGHHIRYSCKYLGSQPFDNANKIVYLTGWKKPVWFGNNYKIIANLKRLECILEFDGNGSRVPEKLDFCLNKAEELLRQFAKQHNIEICSDIQLTPYSHWVVEHKKTGDMLKPLTKKPKNERVQGIYGDSSHPEKLELIGKESAVGAVGMDTLLIDLPMLIESWNKGMVRYMQGVEVLQGAIGQSIMLQNEILVELRQKRGV